MKTLETVLADLTNNSNQKKMKRIRYCEGCGAKEGAPHPTRGFDVILQPLDKENPESPKLCVICRLDLLKKNTIEKETSKNPLNILKQYRLMVLLALITLLSLSGLLMAQPGLPSAPSQAPIDGGLSLLAVAGGAYAIKKLRDKKNGEEELE